MPDDHAALVLTTVGSIDAAARIGRLLVEERLAACVTTVAGARSTYRWEGRVVEEEEQLLLIKTAPATVDRLRERLLAEHPYEVPEVLVLEAGGVPEPYARWLQESAG
ncbi:MAG: divalent-cation tolerance protein CutA [Candidatus Dormibacteraeota bacterium]|nr:divalent-cation tolerance protein CutA [Candidatus Dormibacteraeota bacterium]